jgi:hypothetical protein
MRKTVLKLSVMLLLCVVMGGCQKDDAAVVPNGNTIPLLEIENSQRTIAGLRTNYFKPKNGLVKGIVILGSGNDPSDPAPGDINDSYLIVLSKVMAGEGFASAIVEYQDQPFVGTNFQNFNSNALMLVTDFNSVGNALRTELNLDRNKLVFGGSSYSANCLISQNAWGTAMTDIKGILGIMGSCEIETARNQKVPILAYACNAEPFGTQFGSSLVQNISNATVKSNSFGLTDNTCSGHATANSWITSATEKVRGWIP